MAGATTQNTAMAIRHVIARNIVPIFVVTVFSSENKIIPKPKVLSYSIAYYMLFSRGIGENFQGAIV